MSYQVLFSASAQRDLARVLYRIDDELMRVDVLRVAHRGDAYRQF